MLHQVHQETWHDSTGINRPVWQHLSMKFPDGRDCLAAFLALETAEVLWGSKPGNLISIVNRQRPCGRNLYALWDSYGIGLMEEFGLKFRELADNAGHRLLLIYHEESMDALLAQKKVAAVLARAGYRAPSDRKLTLDALQEKMTAGGFPHEIGVFLGYPLKDVVGFMGWVQLPFSCQGPWKIFGRPDESLQLAELHRVCRCRMAELLSCGAPPLNCVSQAAQHASWTSKRDGGFFTPSC